MKQRARVLLLLMAVCTAGLYAAPDSTPIKTSTVGAMSDSSAKAAVSDGSTVKDEEDFLTDDSAEIAGNKNGATPVVVPDKAVSADSTAKHASVQSAVADSLSKTPVQVKASVDTTIKQTIANTTAASDTSVKAASLVKAPVDTLAKSQSSIKSDTTKYKDEDFLIDDSDVKLKPQKSVAAKALPGDTAVHTDSLTQKTSGDSTHTGVTVVESDSTNHDAAIVEVRPLIAAPAAHVAVEDVRSINFAKNQKEYRSPKLAMFMSLLVPGLGQAYTKNYIKAGIFVLAEAAVITYGVTYNQKGKNAYDKAKNYANQHYNYNKYVTYYNNLKAYFTQKLAQPDSNFYSAYDSSTYHEFERENISKSSGWYNDLSNNTYVAGWDSCAPLFTSEGYSGLANGFGDTVTYYGNKYVVNDSLFLYVNQIDSATGVITGTKLVGYSPFQSVYKSMIKKSNDYYSTASTIFMGLLVNHVVSAIDALISAKAYNSALLGKETLWQHIHLESQWTQARTPQSLPSPGLALKVAF